MKNVWTVTIALLCCTLALPLTACSPSQAKINSVVQQIDTWTGVLAPDATALLTDIAAFDPGDAAVLQNAVTLINTDAPLLEAACKQYLAAPSASTLAQITAFVGELATADSAGLLQVAQVKNPNSQNTAKEILTTIALGLTIASGLLQTINQAPTVQVKVSLNNMKPFLDRAKVEQAFQMEKDRGLLPRGLTLREAGF
jgi:hypothetical protein